MLFDAPRTNAGATGQPRSDERRGKDPLHLVFPVGLCESPRPMSPVEILFLGLGACALFGLLRGLFLPRGSSGDTNLRVQARQVAEHPLELDASKVCDGRWKIP